MAATVIAPRYSNDDFETGSIRSAAPSYVSEAPSYHSNPPYNDPAPPYTPRENRTSNSSNPSRPRRQQQQQQTIGLPPIPPVTPLSVPSLHNFRIPNWSTHNAPASRQLHSVIERRVSAAAAAVDASSSSATTGPSSSNSRGITGGSGGGGGSSRNLPYRAAPRRPYQGFLDGGGGSGSSSSSGNGSSNSSSDDIMRPLEDPYLVGERAAEQARQERLSRERGDDILLQEDKRWDWMLAQMRTWDEREKAWSQFRREIQTGQRKRVLRHIGGRFP